LTSDADRALLRDILDARRNLRDRFVYDDTRAAMWRARSSAGLAL